MLGPNPKVTLANHGALMLVPWGKMFLLHSIFMQQTVMCIFLRERNFRKKCKSTILPFPPSRINGYIKSKAVARKEWKVFSSKTERLTDCIGYLKPGIASSVFSFLQCQADMCTYTIKCWTLFCFLNWNSSWRHHQICELHLMLKGKI